MNPNEKETGEIVGPQKPRIVVHNSDVDFDNVRFHIEVYSDYQTSHLELIDSEDLSEEEKRDIIEKILPWVDRVLNYTLGAWGEATFRPEGMGLIDEVIDPGYHAGYWTFPASGTFREDAVVPEYYRRGDFPKEYKGISIVDDLGPWW